MQTTKQAHWSRCERVSGAYSGYIIAPDVGGFLEWSFSEMAGPISRGLSSIIWRSSSLALTSRPLVVRPVRPSVVISARRFLGDESGISGRQESFTKQGSYEGHGKTSVSILNEDCEGINMIDSFAQDGFRLSDDTKILGPCVIFPTAVLGIATYTVYMLSCCSVLWFWPNSDIKFHLPRLANTWGGRHKRGFSFSLYPS